MKRAIVVDDMQEMCLLYTICLSGEFEVTSVESLKELELVQDKEEISLIILDYHIPNEDFNEILNYVESSFLKAKRILISGHVESLNLKSKYKNNFSDILEKPLKDYSKFREYVINLLEET